MVCASDRRVIFSLHTQFRRKVTPIQQLKNSCNISSYTSFQWNNPMNSQRQSQGCDVSCGIHEYASRFHAISFRTFLILQPHHQLQFAKCWCNQRVFPRSLAIILPIFHHLLQSKAQQQPAPSTPLLCRPLQVLWGPQNPLQNPWFAIRGSIRGSDGKSTSVETHLCKVKRLGIFEGPGKSGTRSIMQSDLLIHHHLQNM